MTLNFTEQELADIRARNPYIGVQDEEPQRPAKKESYSKYRNRKTSYGGVLYDSRREAARAQELDLQLRAGEIAFWCRQPEFVLPGNAGIYRADFIVQYNTGVVIIEDIKGVRTKEYRLKKKLVENTYRVKILEV
jgi:hypothetical protein